VRKSNLKKALEKAKIRFLNQFMSSQIN